jgi:hypothetical protein
MVQPPGAGVPDVHGRPPPNRLQAFKDRYFLAAVSLSHITLFIVGAGESALTVSLDVPLFLFRPLYHYGMTIVS